MLPNNYMTVSTKESQILTSYLFDRGILALIRLLRVEKIYHTVLVESFRMNSQA